MKTKLIVIINGAPLSGKDTLVEAVSDVYPTLNISSVDLVKQAARLLMWDGVTKDIQSRKFLAELKQLSVNYNDAPTKDLIHKTKEFLNTNYYRVLFVHIREQEEIDKYLKTLTDNFSKVDYKFNILKILISNDKLLKTDWDNASDNSENFDKTKYDILFNNDYSNKEIAKQKQTEFINLIKTHLI